MSLLNLLYTATAQPNCVPPRQTIFRAIEVALICVGMITTITGDVTFFNIAAVRLTQKMRCTGFGSFLRQVFEN